MKQFRRFAIITLSLTFLLTACKKKDKEEIKPQPGESKTVDIQVSVPAGPNLNINETTLVSFMESFPVDADGRSKSRFVEGGKNLAFLLDGNKNVIMMGFITDLNKTVSSATTAEALLYFSLGTPLQPQEVRDKFFNDIGSLPQLETLKTQFEEKFAKNTTFLLSDELINVLWPILADIRPDSVNIYNKDRIILNENDKRSGINLNKETIESFSITNTYRRRAHAYIYKTAYKDDIGIEYVIDDDISGDDVSDFDIKIEPIQVMNAIKGNISTYTMGNGLSWAATTTDPLTLALKAEETEATYDVRVVGPGLGLANFTIDQTQFEGYRTEQVKRVVKRVFHF